MLRMGSKVTLHPWKVTAEEPRFLVANCVEGWGLRESGFSRDTRSSSRLSANQRDKRTNNSE